MPGRTERAPPLGAARGGGCYGSAARFLAAAISTRASVSERDRNAVLEANAAFYEAFESGRIENMERVWAGSEIDRCIHPGWPILSGWPSVRQSWLGIFNGSSRIHIEIEEVEVLVVGDLAFVTCIES